MGATVSPITPKPDGVTVSVRLTPKASANRIQGLAEDAAGGVVLKAAVTAPPEKGKANAALIKLLAKAWSLPKTSLTVISGATDRNKVLHIEGDPDILVKQLGIAMKHLYD
ncbi:DUF167 domain-containing protein [Hwanghaeella grinnelliae]|uniref:UPF0235 protein EOI86_15545 n=1 Tax=Hwanghaeella grinnelliae TaxID=2500179 RepID=A0A437QPY9_9PROT|nr:DUF167 family protein [Hwanghaeella grinnelliae]RVU36596.1 DUF167 domain-containing protein [Hwanghaeella grinnelliae]